MRPLKLICYGLYTIISSAKYPYKFYRWDDLQLYHFGGKGLTITQNVFSTQTPNSTITLILTLKVL